MGSPRGKETLGAGCSFVRFAPSPFLGLTFDYGAHFRTAVRVVSAVSVMSLRLFVLPVSSH